jgi:cyclomaltodextrinase / maltogenic alpha-amylase / neopullulanase
MAAGSAALAPPEPTHAWARRAVFYQVFLDRFANGDPTLDPRNTQPWGSAPTSRGYTGGDLRGLTERLPYLEDLGVSAICLTPVFMSSSNHRYNTYDYRRIDPRLGTLEDFRLLLRESERRGMRVLLDGVFNHCGRGFFPFFDVMENGADSSWADWFKIEGFPLQAYGTPRFRAWLNCPELPEFNLANPAVRRYLLEVVDLWTRTGIGGWRLDAVPHVEHLCFWRELRETVRAANPSAYLLAEIWRDASPWLATGLFDGATNYPFRELVLSFVVRRSMRPSEFAGRLADLLRRTGWPTCLTMCNLVGSHDTPRLWTLARGHEAAVKAALLLQFAFPGIPAIYYGDEIGLAGGRDPDNRRTMEWRRGHWNEGLRDCVRALAGLRRASRALQEGTWRTLVADDESGTCAFARSIGLEHVVVAVQNGPTDRIVSVDVGLLERREGDIFRDVLGTQDPTLNNGYLTVRLPPRAAAMFLSSPRP